MIMMWSLSIQNYKKVQDTFTFQVEELRQLQISSHVSPLITPSKSVLWSKEPIIVFAWASLY